MSVAVAIVIAVAALGVALWLAYTALGQVRQLRGDLDQSQRLVNETRQVLESAREELGSTRQELGETRQEVAAIQRKLSETRQELSELRAVAAVIPPPLPPLPKARSSGLDDLREQLRAAHREEESSSGE